MVSKECDEGFGFIGLCTGTIIDSACCKPNQGGQVFGQSGSNPEAACLAAGGKCVDDDKCPDGFFPSGNCKVGVLSTTMCCTPQPGGANTQSAAGGSAGSSMTLEDPLGEATLNGLIGRFVAAFLGMVGALALLVFVYAGIVYMTAGSSDRVKEARETLKYAVLGLGLIVFAYVLTNFFFNALTSAPPTDKPVVKPVTLPQQPTP